MINHISQMAELILLFLVWGLLICLSSGISTENSIKGLGLGLDLNNFSSSDDPFLLFQHWKNEYNHSYETLEEHQNRFEVFKTNMDYIIEMNSKRKSPHSYTLGLNKFADISPQEFRNIYLNKVEMPKHHSNIKPVNLSCKNVPTSLDWRKKGVVTPVKKQGHCSHEAEKKKAVTIDGYVRVAPSDDALLCASIKQPISVYLDSTDIVFYKEGIYDGAKCSNDPYKVDHAVLIVGYDSEGDQDYWIIKNSWGEDWGENGYIRIKRKTGIPNGLCAINAWSYYPTKSR